MNVIIEKCVSVSRSCLEDYAIDSECIHVGYNHASSLGLLSSGIEVVNRGYYVKLPVVAQCYETLVSVARTSDELKMVNMARFYSRVPGRLGLLVLYMNGTTYLSYVE